MLITEIYKYKLYISVVLIYLRRVLCILKTFSQGNSIRTLQSRYIPWFSLYGFSAIQFWRLCSRITLQNLWHKTLQLCPLKIGLTIVQQWQKLVISVFTKQKFGERERIFNFGNIHLVTPNFVMESMHFVMQNLSNWLNWFVCVVWPFVLSSKKLKYWKSAKLT